VGFNGAKNVISAQNSEVIMTSTLLFFQTGGTWGSSFWRNWNCFSEMSSECLVPICRRKPSPFSSVLPSEGRSQGRCSGQSGGWNSHAAWAVVLMFTCSPHTEQPMGWCELFLPQVVCVSWFFLSPSLPFSFFPFLVVSFFSSFAQSSQQ